jgi:hypothetical protein
MNMSATPFRVDGEPIRTHRRNAKYVGVHLVDVASVVAGPTEDAHVEGVQREVGELPAGADVVNHRRLAVLGLAEA